jgi:hypothetical protein
MPLNREARLPIAAKCRRRSADHCQVRQDRTDHVTPSIETLLRDSGLAPGPFSRAGSSAFGRALRRDPRRSQAHPLALLADAGSSNSLFIAAAVQN